MIKKLKKLHNIPLMHLLMIKMHFVTFYSIEKDILKMDQIIKKLSMIHLKSLSNQKQKVSLMTARQTRKKHIGKNKLTHSKSISY
jgi:LPS sulfotransferase NodH